MSTLSILILVLSVSVMIVTALQLWQMRDSPARTAKRVADIRIESDKKGYNAWLDDAMRQADERARKFRNSLKGAYAQQQQAMRQADERARKFRNSLAGAYSQQQQQAMGAGQAQQQVSALTGGGGFLSLGGAPQHTHPIFGSGGQAAAAVNPSRPPWRACYRFEAGLHEWTVRYRDFIYAWERKPSRSQVAAKVRFLRACDRAARPSTTLPDTLGFREWLFDEDTGRLVSPTQGTPWETDRLEAAVWSTSSMVRGVAGIHAKRMPVDWTLLRQAVDENWSLFSPVRGTKVTGVVERFGQYVLGTEGWRAERVVIRELCAPTPEIMLRLMASYPSVKVHLSPHYEAEEV